MSTNLSFQQIFESSDSLNRKAKEIDRLMNILYGFLKKIMVETESSEGSFCIEVLSGVELNFVFSQKAAYCIPKYVGQPDISLPGLPGSRTEHVYPLLAGSVSKDIMVKIHQRLDFIIEEACKKVPLLRGKLEELIELGS